eukprot:793672-Pelagomonas_calceolata.AAC.1
MALLAMAWHMHSNIFFLNPAALMLPFKRLQVSDFGLSVRMDLSETHVSSLFHGTITHMAPEVLLKGTCSKASDVYA